MQERRQFQRYDLSLPAKIEMVIPGPGKKTFDLRTSDVSAGGAFFRTSAPIPEGTQVRLRLMIRSERLQDLTGAEGRVAVAGTVVRSGPAGMAICFDEHYQFGRVGLD